MTSLLILQTDGGGLNAFILPLAMIAIIYFFMIRPQMNRQKKEKKFQSELKKGTRIITTSGIHGKIVDINTNDNTVMIETGAGKMKFEKAAISLELSKKYQETPKKK
ncbi:MAG: preprotein translocase subunit YajC [Flavobacteriaceae bacterium]|nr:preprotein translocase subunit YajC [Flavobacteriaceae bacterium]|tara:strand:+ start:11797 stop:12117 length:321 start_codon:yes stop_codon:yes gene_type:complete